MLLCVLLVGLVWGVHGEGYRYHNFAQMSTRLTELSNSYQNLMKLETAQKKYGLPYPDCGSNLCPIYIVTITDFASLTADRPQVFLSGGLHGDEILGPNIILYLVEYLLNQYPINPWIRYLLQHRLIVIMPAPNAQGFALEQREETYRGIKYDPNRDFPYDNQEKECLNTLAARATVQVFGDHLFVLGVVFHGGTTAISYEWGSTNHEKSSRAEEAPDNTAMSQLAELMQKEAGEVVDHGIEQYKVGRMTDMVYSVRGGFEDWAYAASWAPKLENASLVIDCHSETYGGFNQTAINLTEDSVRLPMYLVETDNRKRPSISRLGSVQGIIQKNTRDDGHISRNIRLSLALIDLAYPYIQNTRSELYNTTHFRISWQVGGSLYVNATYLLWKKYSFNSSLNGDVVASTLTDCPSILKVSEQSSTQQGKSSWLAPHSRFEAFIPLSNTTQDFWAYQIAALTDLQWTYQQNPKPPSPPLTHFALMRTQTMYRAANNNSGRIETNQTVFGPITIVTYEHLINKPIVKTPSPNLFPFVVIILVLLLASIGAIWLKHKRKQPSTAFSSVLASAPVPDPHA